MKTIDDPILILAHRGASDEAPENTLAAFRRALELGADGFELDVQLSADGRLVVIHDGLLSRTTDGRGRVERHTWEQLRRLDAGAWFSPLFRGERIPLLEEVLDLAAGKALVDIEIKKSRRAEEAARAVVECTAAWECRHFIVTSFDPEAIARVKALRPETATGLLLERNRRTLIGDWDFVVAHHRLIDERFVRRIQESGKKIMAWTVDDEAEQKRLAALGVGRLITNRPKMMLNLNRPKNSLTN